MNSHPGVNEMLAEGTPLPTRDDPGIGRLGHGNTLDPAERGERMDALTERQAPRRSSKAPHPATGEKPTSGFEPLTPSLRGRRGVCGCLRSVALSVQDKPIWAVRPRIALRLIQGVVLPPRCHL